MEENKVIDGLKEKLKYNDEKCLKINNIVENTFIFGKENKDKMISKFMEKLKVDEKEANVIYKTVMDIIGDAIINKVKHPFKKDN